MQMSRIRWTAAGLALVLGAVHVPRAAGQIVDEEGVGRLTIGGGIGVSLTSMSNVNSNLSVANIFLENEEIRSIDKVRSGLLTGLDVRYKLGQTPLLPDAGDEERISFMDRLSIGFTWGAVNSETGFEVSRATTRFYARSTTYYPYLLYHVPWFEQKLPRTSFYFGGGPLVLSSVAVEWAVGDSTTNNFIEEGDLSEIAGSSAASGSGLGAVVQVGSSFMLNSRFSLAMDVGYRYAKISNIEMERAQGQMKRFPGDDDGNGQTVIRRPGDWSVIDFFERSPEGRFEARFRPDPMEEGGCAGCPMYYTGGETEIDFSGFFTNLSFRIHF